MTSAAWSAAVDLQSSLPKIPAGRRADPVRLPARLARTAGASCEPSEGARQVLDEALCARLFSGRRGDVCGVQLRRTPSAGLGRQGAVVSSTSKSGDRLNLIPRHPNLFLVSGCLTGLWTDTVRPIADRDVTHPTASPHSTGGANDVSK